MIALQCIVGQFYPITLEYIPDPEKPLKSQTVKVRNGLFSRLICVFYLLCVGFLVWFVYITFSVSDFEEGLFDSLIFLRPEKGVRLVQVSISSRHSLLPFRRNRCWFPFWPTTAPTIHCRMFTVNNSCCIRANRSYKRYNPVTYSINNLRQTILAPFLTYQELFHSSIFFHFFSFFHFSKTRAKNGQNLEQFLSIKLCAIAIAKYIYSY